VEIVIYVFSDGFIVRGITCDREMMEMGRGI
jgi:hypothetical protein